MHFSRKKIPPCAAAMGTLCAGHARGDNANEPCNTDEEKPVTELRKSLLYVLSKDVQNPKPDRRRPRDCDAAVTWTKGTTFRTGGNYLEPVLDDTFARNGLIEPTHPGYKTLVAALVPREPLTPHEVLAMRDYTGSRSVLAVLNELHKRGLFSLFDVHAALDAVNKEE